MLISQKLTMYHDVETTEFAVHFPKVWNEKGGTSPPPTLNSTRNNEYELVK